MGYSYDLRGRLACDGCGHVGGVRRRTCPHKVTGDSLRSPSGQRWTLPYCQPSALCSGCYQKHKLTLHASCKEGAAKSQARYDAIEAGLQQGEFFVLAAWGDWEATVSAGKVGVVFKGKVGERAVLLDKDVYEPNLRLSEYAHVEPWEGCTHVRT